MSLAAKLRRLSTIRVERLPGNRKAAFYRIWKDNKLLAYRVVNMDGSQGRIFKGLKAYDDACQELKSRLRRKSP